jgi:hypothetical protein
MNIQHVLEYIPVIKTSLFFAVQLVFPFLRI